MSAKKVRFISPLAVVPDAPAIAATGALVRVVGTAGASLSAASAVTPDGGAAINILGFKQRRKVRPRYEVTELVSEATSAITFANLVNIHLLFTLDQNRVINLDLTPKKVGFQAAIAISIVKDGTATAHTLSFVNTLGTILWQGLSAAPDWTELTPNDWMRVTFRALNGDPATLIGTADSPTR